MAKDPKKPIAMTFQAVAPECQGMVQTLVSLTGKSRGQLATEWIKKALDDYYFEDAAKIETLDYHRRTEARQEKLKPKGC